MSLSAYGAREGFPPLTQLVVGLGWTPNPKEGEDFDLDASALVLDKSGRVLGDKYFIFYNNLESPEGAVRHTGDNTTGEGEGDDEQLIIDLTKLPRDANKVLFAVSIYDAEKREQSFADVADAYIRIGDGTGNGIGNILTRFDLTTLTGGETVVLFGEVYLGKPGFFGSEEWKFRALGEGYANLEGLVIDYGVSIG